MIRRDSSSSSEQTSSINRYHPVDQPPQTGYSEAGREVSKSLSREGSSLLRRIFYKFVYFAKGSINLFLSDITILNRVVAVIVGTGMYLLLIITNTWFLLPGELTLPVQRDIIRSQLTGQASDPSNPLPALFVLFMSGSVTVLVNMVIFISLVLIIIWVVSKLINLKFSRQYRRQTDRRIILLTMSPLTDTTHQLDTHQPQEQLVGYMVGSNGREESSHLIDRSMLGTGEKMKLNVDGIESLWKIFHQETELSSFEPQYALICVIENVYRNHVYNSEETSTSYLNESQTLPRNEVINALPRADFPWVHWTTLNGVESLEKEFDDDTTVSAEKLLSIETGVVALAEDESQVSEISGKLEKVESAYNSVDNFIAKRRVYYGPIDPTADGTTCYHHRLIDAISEPIRRYTSKPRPIRKSSKWINNNIERVKAGKPVKRSRLSLLRRRPSRPILSQSDQLHIFSVLSGQDVKSANRVGRLRRDQTVMYDISPEQEDRYTTDFGGGDDE